MPRTVRGQPRAAAPATPAPTTPTRPLSRVFANGVEWLHAGYTVATRAEKEKPRYRFDSRVSFVYLVPER
jgi:hypothetical protein